jgi:hypothetical protein
MPRECLSAPAVGRRVDEAVENLPLAVAAEQPVAQLLVASSAGSVVSHEEEATVRERFYGSTIDTRQHLCLAASSDDDPIGFDPPPFSLRTQPQRPGELAELIDVAIDATVADRVRCSAAAAGLPVELALYIAVEAERALAEAVDVVGVDGEQLIAFLDGVAVDADGRGPLHVLVRSLAEYGAALTRGEGQRPSSGSLCVRVPHRVAASWAHAAAAAGLSFDRWLSDLVARAEFARVSWEAAAARSGRSLSEWVLLQAARCARSRNTSPQTTASV